MMTSLLTPKRYMVTIALRAPGCRQPSRHRWHGLPPIMGWFENRENRLCSVVHACAAPFIGPHPFLFLHFTRTVVLPAFEEERRSRTAKFPLSHDSNPVSQQVSLIPKRKSYLMWYHGTGLQTTFMYVVNKVYTCTCTCQEGRGEGGGEKEGSKIKYTHVHASALTCTYKCKTTCLSVYIQNVVAINCILETKIT